MKSKFNQIEYLLSIVRDSINQISQIEGDIESTSVIGNSVIVRFANGSIYKQQLLSKTINQIVPDETESLPADMEEAAAIFAGDYFPKYDISSKPNPIFNALKIGFLAGAQHRLTQYTAKEEKETGGYLESEKQFQLIALRGLGLDYEKHGCTFEQSINGVIHLAVTQKRQLTEHEALPSKDEILKEAQRIYDEANTSSDMEAVRQALTMKLMFIAGAWMARGFKKQ